MPRKQLSMTLPGPWAQLLRSPYQGLRFGRRLVAALSGVFGVKIID